MKKIPIGKAFTLMESGPVVLVTTHDGNRANIMTISWAMVMDFTPLFAITTGPWNFSYAALKKTRECVIAIPTVDLIDTVVGVGTCSGADTDKFARFGLTPAKGKYVRENRGQTTVSLGVFISSPDSAALHPGHNATMAGIGGAGQ
ncbi:MAG: flavin reductase family protein [Gammaproteobacteria bacterium]|nr:flavin reductase family protein [Gammaproteobacteria bacterium]